MSQSLCGIFMRKDSRRNRRTCEKRRYSLYFLMRWDEGTGEASRRDIFSSGGIAENSRIGCGCIDRFSPRTPKSCSDDLPETRTRVVLSSHHATSYSCSSYLGCSVSLSETHKKILQTLVGGFFYDAVVPESLEESLAVRFGCDISVSILSKCLDIWMSICNNDTLDSWDE